MTEKKKVILITGSAGFIGFHLSKRLLNKNNIVIGYDNINNYYAQSLKEARLSDINNFSLENNFHWKFIKGDLENSELLLKTFEKYNPDIVINLAAQAGVRYSIKNPSAYINSNIIGFNNILECCRSYPIKNLIYASSSSVYGGNIKLPFTEKDNVDHPMSLYAATKKSNELLAHAYSSLYNIPTTGLRLFTVYGPWGRPDMAPMIFAKSIIEKKTIKVFNHGKSDRDFTYIDDVIESIVKLIDKPAKPNQEFNSICPDPSKSWAPFQIFNIGNSDTVNLIDFINILEKEIGIKAKKEFLPLQTGDVVSTHADTTSIQNYIGFKPKTNLKDGIKKFINWYNFFYQYKDTE